MHGWEANVALGVKVSMLTCMFFIGGICWIVNNVAAPIARTPSVFAPGSENHGPISRPEPQTPREDQTELAARFEHPSTPIGFNAESDANRLVANLPMIDAQLTADDIPQLVGRNVLPLDTTEVALDEPAFATAIGEEPIADELLIPQSNASPRESAKPVTLTATGVPETTIIDAPSNAESKVVLASTTLSNPGIEKQPTEETPKATQYEVQRGDSIATIVKRTLNSDDNLAFKAFLDANPQLKGRRDLLYVGETLNIPTQAKTASSLRRAEGDVRLVDMGAGQALTRQKNVERRAIAEPRPTSTAKNKANTRRGVTNTDRWYTVQPKDSLQNIARRTLNDANRWREIAEINGLKDVNRLEEGRKLRLPKDDT